MTITNTYTTSNMTKRDIFRAKQKIGVIQNIEKIDTSRKYRLISMASFHCNSEDGATEDYDAHIITLIDMETGETHEMNTSSVPFVTELKEMVKEFFEDEEGVTFEIVAVESKKHEGRKFYKPVLV